MNLRALVGAYTAEEHAEFLEAKVSNDVPPDPPSSDWALREGVRALTSVYLAASRGNGHTGDQLMERFKAVVEEGKTDEVSLQRQIVANLRTTFTHLENDSGPSGVTCHEVICAAACPPNSVRVGQKQARNTSLTHLEAILHIPTSPMKSGMSRRLFWEREMTADKRVDWNYVYHLDTRPVLFVALVDPNAKRLRPPSSPHPSHTQASAPKVPCARKGPLGLRSITSTCPLRRPLRKWG